MKQLGNKWLFTSLMIVGLLLGLVAEPLKAVPRETVPVVPMVQVAVVNNYQGIVIEDFLLEEVRNKGPDALLQSTNNIIKSENENFVLPPTCV